MTDGCCSLSKVTFFDAAQYEVEEFFSDKEARAFIEQHHYLHSYPATRFRFRLKRRGETVGMAIFSVPVRSEVLTKHLPFAVQECVELGRLFLLDSVERNGESWFLARCFHLLRQKGIRGVVAFADPGAHHLGIIYQALNGVYVGQGKSSILLRRPDGKALHSRTVQRVRQQKYGWRSTVATLSRLGLPWYRDGDDPSAWIALWTLANATKEKQPGKHKYLWALQKRDRRLLPPGLPYPKDFSLG